MQPSDSAATAPGTASVQAMPPLPPPPEQLPPPLPVLEAAAPQLPVDELFAAATAAAPIRSFCSESQQVETEAECRAGSDDKAAAVPPPKPPEALLQRQPVVLRVEVASKGQARGMSWTVVSLNLLFFLAAIATLGLHTQAQMKVGKVGLAAAC